MAWDPPPETSFNFQITTLSQFGLQIHSPLEFCCVTSPFSRFTRHTVTNFLLRDHFWHYLMHTHSTTLSPSHLTQHPCLLASLLQFCCLEALLALCVDKQTYVSEATLHLLTTSGICH